MANGDNKRYIFTTLAVILVGIATGMFLRGRLLPSSKLAYLETVKTDKSISTRVQTLGSHKLGTVVTTTIVTTTTITPVGISPTPIYMQSLNAQSKTPAAVQAPAPETSVPAHNPYEIEVKDREFRPTTLTVPVGTTVVWVNQDMNEAHTVTSVEGLFSGTLSIGGVGASFTYTFTKEGTYLYQCENHSQMLGTITAK